MRSVSLPIVEDYVGSCRGGADGEDEVLVPHRCDGVVDDSCLFVLVVDMHCKLEKREWVSE